MYARVLFLIFAATLFSTAAAADGDEAMFGLRWGMTTAQVKAMGVTLSNGKNDQGLETYETTSLPKNLADSETYVLLFANNKLAKIRFIGTNITDDPTGFAGKNRFNALRSALAEKYGKPTRTIEESGHSLYREPDEFYQCLKYTGCGGWMSVFETKDKVVGIQLRGLARGIGYVTIDAEASPQWNEFLDARRAGKIRADKEAL